MHGLPKLNTPGAMQECLSMERPRAGQENKVCFLQLQPTHSHSNNYKTESALDTKAKLFKTPTAVSTSGRSSENNIDYESQNATQASEELYTSVSRFSGSKSKLVS